VQIPRFVAFLLLALAIVGTPVRTASRTDSWRWQIALVDPTREHLELRYGSSDDGGWDDWVLVARVGRPVNRVFPVHFVLPDDDGEDAEAREAVGRNLDYYLVELGKRDPWEYATYHTMTLANVYSRVHWGWIRRGVASGRPEKTIVGEQIAERKVQTPLMASDRRAACACDRERGW
jgi:hypothetical protein